MCPNLLRIFDSVLLVRIVLTSAHIHFYRKGRPMLLLNLHAVPALLVVFVAAGVLGTTLGSESEWFTFLLFGAVPFVAGRISARLGLQDRFFFMPIWWIGMLGMSTMGLIPLGVPDYLAWIPGVIGIGLLHPYYKAKLEKRLWEKAVAKCQDLSDADSPKRFWKQIKNVLFFPEKIPASDAIIQHNLTLIERMRQRVAGGKEVETLAYETLSVLEGLLQLQAQTIKVDPDTLSDEERKKVAELNRTTLNQVALVHQIAGVQAGF